MKYKLLFTTIALFYIACFLSTPVTAYQTNMGIKILTDEEMRPYYEERYKEIQNGTYDRFFLPTPPTVPFAQNTPTGFRKIRWGDTVEKHKESLRKLTEEEFKRLVKANIDPSSLCGSEYEYKAYVVKNDKLSIGSTKLFYIIYYFTKETGLLRVDLLYSQDEEQALNKYFQARWGDNNSLSHTDIQNKTGGHMAQWFGDDVTASIYHYGILKQNRRLSLVSMSRTKEYAILWMKENTFVQKQKKKNFNKAVNEDF